MTPSLSAQSPSSPPAQGARTRLLLALVVLLLIAAPLAAFGGLAWQQRPAGAASDAGMTMEAANALYTAGQFELAAQAYLQLVAQGRGGRALLYNLGVAQLEAGAATQAVDALRTAQRAYPRDTNIRAALAETERLARTSLPLAEPVDLGAAIGPAAGADIRANPDAAIVAAPVEHAPGRLEQVRLQWLSATEAALAALLLWTLLAALLLVAYAAPRRSGRRSLSMTAAIAVGAALVFALLLLTV